LLSQARKQIAPFAESTIPGLRAQVARMNAERDQLIARVKRVVQFSGYVEHAISAHPESQDASAFCVALRPLQEELKVSDKYGRDQKRHLTMAFLHIFKQGNHLKIEKKCV
jgi:hypothetical protein